MSQQSQERLSKINELAEKAATELGLILLNVRIGQQGKNKSLEVSIYRKDPAISFSDCEQMSKSLAHFLEIEETKGSAIINDSYLLEVVSAGIDRQLTNSFEFNLFAGSKVLVMAKEKIASLGIQFTGILLGGDEHSVSLCQTIPLANKSSKAPAKAINRKQAANHVEAANNEKLNISLQQIYRICLCPDIKENKNAAQ